MNLVVGFSCLVAMVVLELAIGVPEPQRNSGTFGRGVRDGGDRLGGRVGGGVRGLGSGGFRNGQFGRYRGVSRAGFASRGSAGGGFGGGGIGGGRTGNIGFGGSRVGAVGIGGVGIGNSGIGNSGIGGAVGTGAIGAGFGVSSGFAGLGGAGSGFGGSSGFGGAGGAGTGFGGSSGFGGAGGAGGAGSIGAAFGSGNTAPNSFIGNIFGSASAGDVIRGALAGAAEVLIEENSNKDPCSPRKPHTNCQISDAWRTADSDGDGHVDSCDNCPRVPNPDQADKDGNRVGDACDSHRDTDRDGIPDGIDNCINEANHGQSNADGDEYGDECDIDADNDGITNIHDNCYLVPNPDQSDTDNDGIGDACQDDFDGDCQPDHLDICPKDPNIHRADLTHFHAVSLDKVGFGQNQTEFTVTDDGTTASQHINSKPGLMFGEHSLSDLDFRGTLTVDAHGDDDYVGFIFGYRDAKNFYVVMWKKHGQGPFECGGKGYAESGLQLKRVHSNTGPSCALQNALWSSTSTSDQVTVLWKAPNTAGWESNTAYHWELTHRPSEGLIRFRIYEGTPGAGFLVDSGNIYDHNIKSGYVGLYCHSQEGITWSNIKYGCNVNPGECPPLRPSCPPNQFFGPPSCTIDKDCLDTEKCCGDPCFGKSICKPSGFRQQQFLVQNNLQQQFPVQGQQSLVPNFPGQGQQFPGQQFTGRVGGFGQFGRQFQG